jgi:hypothetical protein
MAPARVEGMTSAASLVLLLVGQGLMVGGVRRGGWNDRGRFCSAVSAEMLGNG